MSDYVAPAEANSHIAASVVIDMPIEQAWEKLQDFSIAHNYVAGVTRTEITTEKKTGLGASRRVYLGDKKYNNETIIEFGNYNMLMRLHIKDKELPPFLMAQWRYALSKATENTTRATMTMSYATPWGLFGTMLNKLVIVGAAKKATAKVASGFKHYYETNVPATDADRERLLPAVTVEAS